MDPIAIIIAQVVLAAAGVYAALGLLVGLAFVFRGVNQVDQGARASGWPFRLTILPGVVALWPLMLLKWKRARRRAHA